MEHVHMSGHEFTPDQELDTFVADRLTEPPRYQVLLHNDNYSTMDFVVRVLRDVFKKDGREAEKIMMRVHKEGKGVCGIYTAEVAETKVVTVHSLAKKEGFPLRSSMEEV